MLLGWWHAGHIVAPYAAEVTDPCVTASTWSRDEERAQQALKQGLSDLDHPGLGYIGDWHTHPARSGPSKQDEH